MSELIEAILKHQVGVVREISDNHPEQLHVTTESGMLPADLAQGLGNPISFVALLKAGAPALTAPVKQEDWESLFISYVMWWSEGWLCARWLNNMEYFLWRAAQNVPHWKQDTYWVYGDGQVVLPDEVTLAELRFLAEKSKSWPHWEDKEPRCDPLAAWRRRYEQWWAVNGV